MFNLLTPNTMGKTNAGTTGRYAVLFLIAALGANAQTQDSTKQQLKEVVVSATRSEKDPLTVGRSVTVITSEQIKSSGANNLPELLASQEGISVTGTGHSPGQIQTIFMRGASGNHCAVMIDGIRISDPSTNDNGMDLGEISLANIDRIEIVRGSHSTMYGSSAIGGVVNIITRKKHDKPGFHSDLDLRAGNFGPGTSATSQNVALNFTHKSGFYVNTELLNLMVKGLDATLDTVTDPNNYEHIHREKDDFKKLDLVGKLGFKTEKIDAYASYKNVNQEVDVDDGAFNDDDNYTVGFNRSLITVGASYKPNEKFKLSYSGGLTNVERVALDDSSIIDDNNNYDRAYFKGTYTGETMTHELQANVDLKGISIIAGGGLFSEKMSAETHTFAGSVWGDYEAKTDLDSLEIHAQTVSEFLHIDIDGSLAGEKLGILSLGLGLRNVSHEFFGNHLTYEINPSMKVGEAGRLFLSYTTGFNAPSLYQLYAPETDLFSKITRGNKGLKPETSASWEFGYKQKVGDNAFVSFSYFRTQVDNSIDYVYLWDKNVGIDTLSFAEYKGDTYLNVGKQTNRGVEIGANVKVTEKLRVYGNVSLVSGRLEYDPGKLDTSHSHGHHVQLYSNGVFIDKKSEVVGLIRRPSAANVGLSYTPIANLTLGARLKVMGARGDVYYDTNLGPFGALASKNLGDYTLVDLLLSYKVKGLSVNARAENIFDTEYQEIIGYSTRGLGVYFGIGYSF